MPKRAVGLERVDLDEAAAGAGRRAADDRHRGLGVGAVAGDERAAVAAVLADAEDRAAPIDREVRLC